MADYAKSYAQDRAEIEDLMARYLFAMDYNDFDTYAQTFTENGRLEFARGWTEGRDNIREMAMGFKKAIAGVYVDCEGNPAVLRHVLGQSVIRVEGDRAFATAFWYEMANNGPDKTLKMGTFGIYEDELERVDGSWLFSSRIIRNEFLPGRESGQVNPVIAMDRDAQVASGAAAASGAASS